jgi:NAD(P)-dependent dehydrogenase (short-subunit alcohol dehydrogenase family)
MVALAEDEIQGPSLGISDGGRNGGASMRTAIVLGSNSDIAKGLTPLLERDGWSVGGWQRAGWHMPAMPWDLVVCALGCVAPVGLWHDIQESDLFKCFDSNLFTPKRLIDEIWQDRNPGASICFLAGSNPNMIMPGYFAYNVAKMALLKAVEQMDYETPDAKFFAIGPGTILTKIHQATLEARWQNPKLEAALNDDADQQPKILRVYDTLMWCIKQPKEVVGGRNICASDVQIDDMARRLKEDNALWKLRRHEAR